METATSSVDSGFDLLQSAVDAAFPILHGGQDFSDEPSLRATLEQPVRRALEAAGLPGLMREVQTLQEVIRQISPVVEEFEQALHPEEGLLPYATATLDMAVLEKLQALISDSE